MDDIRLDLQRRIDAILSSRAAELGICSVALTEDVHRVLKVGLSGEVSEAAHDAIQALIAEDGIVIAMEFVACESTDYDNRAGSPSHCP